MDIQEGGVLNGAERTAYKICFRRRLSVKIRAGGPFQYY